ncbi:hypothetical protein L228DRAFT_242627 [Xylona heveae TC161]|uniref:Alpha N-terminal protein methyltransferase 1 n=1 Tax=Xylona heveae (strain CBS 132557 / TC161) TaxID=1328760 RepID=A0A165JG72_XYLHT|nr:hypothetical protein L228DRAFT_242627 [Xylona heveae TC161]KZF26195.1 hypothetical protein L228DRAFT_242627 [Xylona heveae TC161]
MAEAPDAHIDRTAGLAYWNSIPATVNGMLGGFPQISRIDLVGSANFLTKLRRQFPSTGPSTSASTSSIPSSHPSPNQQRLPPLSRAVDCGAGIGRITHGFLSNVAQTVDVVEPVEKFTTEITSGKSFAALREAGKIGNVYNVGLEDWDPTVCHRSSSSETVAPESQEHGDGPQKKKQKTTDAPKYDLIWNQWCVGHLTDEQLVAYLKRCAQALAPGGWIIVKENNTTSTKKVPNVKPKWIEDEEEEDLYDEEDSSVTRSDGKFRAIFERAGLRLVKAELQSGFPRGLFPVRFYALQPVDAGAV